MNIEILDKIGLDLDMWYKVVDNTFPRQNCKIYDEKKTGFRNVKISNDSAHNMTIFKQYC